MPQGDELDFFTLADNTELVGIFQRRHGGGRLLQRFIQASPLIILARSRWGEYGDVAKLAKCRSAVEFAPV
ncbi:hypothetical protein D3C85_1684400 [compost metagenome]